MEVVKLAAEKSWGVTGSMVDLLKVSERSA